MNITRLCTPALLVLVIGFSSCDKAATPVPSKEAATPQTPQKNEPPLYHAEVDARAEGGTGKALIITLDEVERHDRYSFVRVKRTSGASVPSIMFVVHGFYQMAKTRGVKYFINLKEWEDAEGNWVYKVGFSRDRTVDVRAYFGEDIDLSKDLEFLSVEDYDLLWGPK